MAEEMGWLALVCVTECVCDKLRDTRAVFDGDPQLGVCWLYTHSQTKSHIIEHSYSLLFLKYSNN